MKAILTPDISPAMGLVIFKPSKELLPLFENGRVVISPEPAHMKNIVSGPIPHAKQPLANKRGLEGFFNSDEVIRKLGGIGILTEHVKTLSNGLCQATEEDEDKYHFHRFCALHTESGVVWVCHHHDNHYRNNGPTEALNELARSQRVEWIIGGICQALGKESDHVLSLQELCWWAFTHNTANLLTDYVMREAAGMSTRIDEIKSEYKESELVVEHYEADYIFLNDCFSKYAIHQTVYLRGMNEKYILHLLPT